MEAYRNLSIATSGGCERARKEISRFAVRARRGVNVQNEIRFERLRKMFACLIVNDVGQQENPGLYPVKGKGALITCAARGIGDLTVQNPTWQKTKCLWSIFGKRFPSQENIMITKSRQTFNCQGRKGT